MHVVNLLLGTSSTANLLWRRSNPDSVGLCVSIASHGVVLAILRADQLGFRMGLQTMRRDTKYVHQKQSFTRGLVNLQYCSPLNASPTCELE